MVRIIFAILLVLGLLWGCWILGKNKLEKYKKFFPDD